MRLKLLRYLNLVLLLPTLLFSTSKIADLTPSDVHTKVNEFLFNHITEKKLTKDLMKRSIDNFIEQLDPTKTYLTKAEIQKELNLTDEDLEQVLTQFYKSDFSTFETLYQKMLSAIERRNKMEQDLANTPFLEDVQAKDIAENSWSENEKELKEKLLKVRSLQHKFSAKLEKDFKDKYFILLDKRRKWKEQEITGPSKELQKPLIYSYLLKAIASALDSQTNYFPPNEANHMMMQVQQRLLGVGVRLVDDLTGFKILEIIEGGPAKKQGELKVNDRIIAVDGEFIAGMDIHQAVQMIQGRENTNVKLTVLREAENKDSKPTTLDITIKRGGIVIEESRLEAYLEPYADGVIAHIALHGFYQDPNSSSAEDVYNKITEIKTNNNLKGIVFDLRDNAGGLLVQGVAITSFFIGKGVVASTKQYDGTILHFRNEQPNILWDGPLIVLINKASASCAEIVAQSLKDYGRAIIVGDMRSFGKGTYQLCTIMPHKSTVNPKGEYKITQGMYYTVSGKTPQIVGVQSDIVVPGYLSEAKYGEEFSKYPVANDTIEASYDDKLLDIFPWRREQYKKQYLNNLQVKTQVFSTHIERLKNNSTSRIERNKDYQTFLEQLKAEEANEDVRLGQNDLQLLETFNIMKDLIYLYEKGQTEKN